MFDALLQKIRFNGSCKKLHFCIYQISGTDRFSFIQSQSTQDINQLLEGMQFQYHTFLNPQGRIQAVFNVVYESDQLFCIVPKNQQVSFEERFHQFLVSEDVSLNLIYDQELWVLWGVVLRSRAFNLLQNTAPTETLKILSCYVAGEPASLVLDPSFVPQIAPQTLSSVTNIDQPIEYLSDEDLWLMSSLHGLWDIVDAEFSMKNQLLNETILIDRAVSFTKGCYPGQETVVKINTRKGSANFPVLLCSNDSKAPTHNSNDSLVLVEHPIHSCNIQQVHYVFCKLSRELRSGLPSIYIRISPQAQAQLFQLYFYPLVESDEAKILQEALFYALELYNKEKKTDSAIILLTSLLTFREKKLLPDIYESLGVIYLNEQKYLEAIHCFEELIKIDPDNIMSYTNLSVLHMKLGHIEIAEDFKAQATVKSFEFFGKKNQEAKNQKQLQKQKEEEAQRDQERRKQLFLQVIEIDPDDEVALLGMADILYAENNFTEAITYLTHLNKVHPPNLACYVLLAQAYQKLNDKMEFQKIVDAGLLMAAKKSDSKFGPQLAQLKNSL